MRSGASKRRRLYMGILALGRIGAENIPGFRRSVVFLWRPIGSLLFRLACRNACRKGNVGLHVGAGNVRLEGWLNTDIMPYLAPLFLDATRRFPIGDNTVSYIFSEHFIEHVSRSDAVGFVNESFRVLKPGGILRVATPDVEALAQAYLNDPEHVGQLNERNRRLGYRHSSYPVDILNTAFLEDRHACLYDGSTLQELLDAAGFQDITRCKVGESRHAALSGIEGHDVGSIEDKSTCVMEGTKPPL